MVFEAVCLSFVCFMKMKWLFRGYRDESGQIEVFEFIKNVNDSWSKNGHVFEADEFEQPTSILIANALFMIVPILITMRVLVLFRISKWVGLIQISFSKMIPDVRTWIFFVIFILIGFSSSIFILASTTINHHKIDACVESLGDIAFKRNELTLLSYVRTLRLMFNIMIQGGPDDDLGACLIDPWQYTITFTIIATFSMLMVIVLVNLLIAMMSKTYDTFADEDVREHKWLFYKSQVWLTYLRQEYVMPVPFNILPNFYEFFAKTTGKRAVLLDENLEKQAENYDKISRKLVQRWRVSKITKTDRS